MELAFETKVPSISAASVEDSAENIRIFKQAVKKLRENHSNSVLEFSPKIDSAN